MRLFEILEHAGWIAGFPAGHWGFSCTITNPCVNLLEDIRSGSPLSGDRLEFTDEDRAMLGNAGNDAVFIVHGDDLAQRNAFALEVQRVIES